MSCSTLAFVALSALTPTSTSIRSCKTLRDKRYDLLLEPVQIGPVTAKNGFYQVPHCTGLGWLRPRMLATLRGMKAEGG